MVNPTLGPALVVQSVLQPRHAPWGPLRRIVPVIGWVVRPGREGDPQGVGRPDGRLDRFLEPCELARFAGTVGRQHEQLRGIVAACGREGEPPPIRRPAWVRVALGAGGQLPRLRAAVDRHRPHRAPRLVRFLVDPGPDVRDRSRIRREPWIRRVGQPVDVVGSHATHELLLLPDACDRYCHGSGAPGRPRRQPTFVIGA